MVYRMFGAFFFGAADKLESALRREKRDPEVLILGYARSWRWTLPGSMRWRICMTG